jgi:glycosyltransferase involved in cell wall biosynthesis
MKNNITDSVIKAGNATPLVSVITPAYNQAAYLGETIESILNQDYKHIEYIILNDGSTDNTVELLEKYTGKLIWETHANMGETLTVNKGVGMAQGEIITVVNADDLLLPGAVSTAVAFMQFRQDILVAYPDWNVIDPNSRVVRNIQVPEYDYLYTLKYHQCVVGPGAFIRRRAFDMAGLRDPEFRYVADFEFWMRLGLFGEFARIPHTLAAWREHPEAASRSCRGSAMAEEHIRMMQKYYARPNIPDAVRRVRSEAFCRAHITAALTSGAQGRLIAKHCVMGFWCHPPSVLANVDKWKAGVKAIIRSCKQQSIFGGI